MGKSSVAFSLIVVALFVSACSSISPGPKRLYSVEEETQGIRESLSAFSLVEFSRLDEPARFKYRNDWIAARMYAIDIQYTTYEAGLTTDKQAVGFGAAAATLGLTTASGLATSTMSKDIMTGVAGAVTGARAAYENDMLLARSVQWVQSQMRTQRSHVAERILRGTRLSTLEYPLAAALTDLEDYYRAGTFTGGMLGTSETLGTAAQLASISRNAVYVGTYDVDATSELIQKYITTDDAKKNATRVRQLNRFLLELGYSVDVRTIVDLAEARAIRESLIKYATTKKVDLNK